MVKKILVGFGVFLLLSILAAAQTAPAKDAKAEAKADANPGSVLGALEATISFCGKVDPESADKYKEMGKLFTNGQTDEAVARIRDSKEYKDAADQTRKQLEKLPPKQALATCKGDSGGNKGDSTGKK